MYTALSFCFACKEKKAAKVAEVARLQAMLLATKLSELMTVNIAALRDQLKKHKLMGKKGSAVTQINRTAYALTLQTLLLQADPEANDLPDAESGIDGRMGSFFNSLVHILSCYLSLLTMISADHLFPFHR